MLTFRVLTFRVLTFRVLTFGVLTFWVLAFWVLTFRMLTFRMLTFRVLTFGVQTLTLHVKHSKRPVFCPRVPLLAGKNVSMVSSLNWVYLKVSSVHMLLVVSVGQNGSEF
jgi:hypothetical protein